ncbi:CoA transferase subunit A [Blastococcus sp. Marseille-P5729]|uniref:CoA transferase subunit A n=1 Tax=Blastococcus sp. Marseille-P5729 TaxID=2086582 RepID=UPI000D11372A|nr:CoA transferase subunit A [Blastococcus sp. Marseille-P5729]
MDKVVQSAAEAVADIGDGASIAVGGFGLCGVPQDLIDALREKGSGDLTVISNNCGIDGDGLGVLLEDKKISKVIASYVGENKAFAQQYLTGVLELELTPQGTIAERLRAGGVGIPGFYTVTGAGTWVAEGGIPTKYDSDGNVVKTSAPKETKEFDGKQYVLETAIVSDFALVKAAKADRHGNLVFNESARNFNPPAAMSGKVCIVEAEEIVEPGRIDPDAVHLPGVYVHRIIQSSGRKPIEKRTTRPKEA